MIGMIGGMSWESTAEYYRLLNELTRQRLGGLHSASCLVHSVDFADIEKMQAAGEWDRSGELLASAASGLQRAGASVLLLCTNTMHKVAHHIQNAVDVSFLDIRDITAAAIKNAGMIHVGLLATAYTMEQSFYIDRLQSNGLVVTIPDSDDRQAVHRIIYDELCMGIVREESRRAFVEVIERLAAASCEGVILGCTEIELLVSAEDSSLPIFPTTRLHVEAALDAVGITQN